MDHDDILKRHRSKFEEHKAWMQQQQDALHQLGSVNPAARAANGAPPSHNASPSASTTTPQRFNQQQQQRSSVMQGQSPIPQPAVGVSWGGLQNTPQSEQRAKSPSNPYSNRSTSSPLNVHMRSTQWARRKEQRLSELREMKDVVDVADCTFHPEVHSPNRSGSGSGSARRDRGSDGQIGGLETYLKRQERARQLLREREARQQNTGAGWTGMTTTPEEFTFGYRPNQTIPSLKQPLRAPGRNVMDAFGAAVDVTPSKFAISEGSLPPQGMFSSKTSLAITESAPF